MSRTITAPPQGGPELRLRGTTQSDFPPKETSWWWVTIAGGQVTKVEQQFLP